MKIVGIERDKFATNFYRVVQPLTKMHQHGLAECSTIPIEMVNGESATQIIAAADIVLMYCPSSDEWLNFIKTCRKQGKIVVADFDDDPFNTSPWNPAYKHCGTTEVAYEWPDGTRDMLWSRDMVGSKGETDYFNIERNIRFRYLLKHSFRKADLITTTTPILKEAFTGINSNVAIVPNLIDLNMYPQCEIVKKEVRIGWQGGSSHYEDLYEIIAPMKDVLTKNDNVKFIYFGDLRLSGLLKDLPQDKVEYCNWTAHTAYPYMLKLLNLDIGICPLADNIFNRRKSAIKYFEYSAVGAATIATNIPPYADVITDGKDGVLVANTKKAWIAEVEQLIKDKDKRVRLARNAYENIEQNHNADTKAHIIRDAYEAIIKQEVMV